jgi:putative oxidoreductase
MNTNFGNDPRAPIGIALLRVSLGAMFVAHGLLKVLVFTLPGTAQFFAAHGFPAWTAYPVALGELAAGALLILGWRTRVVALATLPVLLGAAWVHVPNGWVFNATNGGWEYPVYLAILAVAQSLLGAGAWALDGRREPRTMPHRSEGLLAG